MKLLADKGHPPKKHHRLEEMNLQNCGQNYKDITRNKGLPP